MMVRRNRESIHDDWRAASHGPWTSHFVLRIFLWRIPGVPKRRGTLTVWLALRPGSGLPEPGGVDGRSFQFHTLLPHVSWALWATVDRPRSSASARAGPFNWPAKRQAVHASTTSTVCLWPASWSRVAAVPVFQKQNLWSVRPVLRQNSETSLAIW